MVTFGRVKTKTLSEEQASSSAFSSEKALQVCGSSRWTSYEHLLESFEKSGYGASRSSSKWSSITWSWRFLIIWLCLAIQVCSIRPFFSNSLSLAFSLVFSSCSLSIFLDYFAMSFFAMDCQKSFGKMRGDELEMDQERVIGLKDELLSASFETFCFWSLKTFSVYTHDHWSLISRSVHCESQ